MPRPAGLLPNAGGCTGEISRAWVCIFSSKIRGVRLAYQLKTHPRPISKNFCIVKVSFRETSWRVAHYDLLQVVEHFVSHPSQTLAAPFLCGQKNSDHVFLVFLAFAGATTILIGFQLEDEQMLRTDDPKALLEHGPSYSLVRRNRQIVLPLDVDVEFETALRKLLLAQTSIG